MKFCQEKVVSVFVAISICWIDLGKVEAASLWDQIPFVSQTKSFVQWVAGDSEGARATQDNFIHSPLFPYIPLGKALVESIGGDGAAAGQTMKRMGGQYVSNLEGLVDGTPVVGHAKAGIHYAVGDRAGGDRVIKSSTRGVGVIVGAAVGSLGGPAGAAAGAATGGLIMDGAITGVESAIQKDYRPSGHIHSVTKMVRGEAKPGDYFDTGLSIAGDLAGGYVYGKGVANSASSTASKSGSGSVGKSGSSSSPSASNLIRCGRAVGGSCGGSRTQTQVQPPQEYTLRLTGGDVPPPPNPQPGVGANFVPQNPPNLNRFPGTGRKVGGEPLVRTVGVMEGVPGSPPVQTPFLQGQINIPKASVPNVPILQKNTRLQSLAAAVPILANKETNPATNGQPRIPDEESPTLPLPFKSQEAPYLMKMGGMYFQAGVWSPITNNAIVNNFAELKLNPSNKRSFDQVDGQEAEEDDDDDDDDSTKLCVAEPQIDNMSQEQMSDCRNTEVGHRCRLRCEPNYQPNLKSVLCKKENSWDDAADAKCEPNTKPVCRDHFNRPVDWYAAYRLPITFIKKGGAKKGGNKEAERKNSFLFITNEGLDALDFVNLSQWNRWNKEKPTSWILDEGILGLENNAVGNTLSPMEESSLGNDGSPLKYTLYSDQPPQPHLDKEKQQSASDAFGHSKGALVHDGDVGFFMLHNLPRFPGPNGQTTGFGSPNKGQLFVCISLKGQDNIETAQRHIQNLRPCVYSSNIYERGNSNQLCPFIVDKPGTASSSPLLELRLAEFGLFAKGEVKPGHDIYRLLADRFNQDVLVQTERKRYRTTTTPPKGNALASDCPPNKRTVQNLNTFQFQESTKVGSTEWRMGQDHAKWLVAQQHSNLFCAGDMNRAGSQKERWGGAVCIENESVAMSFKNLIEGIEPCPAAPGA